VEKYRRGYNREKETGGAAAASYYKQMKEAEARAKAMQKFRKEYEEGAKAIFNPVDTSSPAGSPSSKGGKGGRGGGGTTHVLTEEQSIAKQIQDLTQEYIHATDERKTAIRSEIATLQERQKVIQQMKDEALGKTYTPVTDINKPGQGVSVMSGIDIKLPETISALSPLEAMNKELERTQELMMKAASPEEWAILNEHLESVKKNIEDFQGGGKQQANEAKNVTKSWQAASSAISSVGSALQSLEDPSARVFGIIAQAIASVAQGFAGALASPATTSEGIWAWIAAAAAGTATMISTIASIKSATSGNFAEGGIVPGNSYSGDNIRAYGLNSGELILNRSQQDSIASQLQDGGMQNLRLSATVTGDQIRLVLNNNGKRKGFGEQLTFK
jgi:predicted  nucleic acid-binding Zn-ribbon protein